MNDFGVFQAIKQLVEKDEFLSKKMTSVVTEARPDMMVPYMMVRFKNAQVDIPCFIQTALVGCTLEITSHYHGDQEIHDLMSRLNVCLDGACLDVHSKAINLQGKAVFKLAGQEQSSDKGIRTGKLRYQIKITMRRDKI